MSLTVCISASISHMSRSGGAAWLYLNWALGLQALGCRIIWLETEVRDPKTSTDELQSYLSMLDLRLKSHGLTDVRIALGSQSGDPFPWDDSGWYMSLADAALEADLFLNLAYHTDPGLVGRFHRTAFVDTDPGLMQLWLSRGELDLAEHDVYFTTSETVGTPEARFPDAGLTWLYTPTPVFVPAWPVVGSSAIAPYVTVSNWWGDWIDYEGLTLSNEKRSGFLEFLDLPAATSAPLELALTLTSAQVDEDERRLLEAHGWRVRPLWEEKSWSVSDYQRYVQGARGEFSCAKPFYVRLNTSWLADRTTHFLASGKPAIVQYTGPSSILPDAEGIFRFRNQRDAVRAFETLESEYEWHCRAARELVMHHFDAQQVIRSVLERAVR